MIVPCSVCGKNAVWVTMKPPETDNPEEIIQYDYRCSEHKDEEMTPWILR